jgi:formate hydrogenlyase subunit 3/multisubunit Na+/H+ antiporter MnhD subunit
MASVTGGALLLFFVSCACGILLSALVDQRHSGVVIGITGALASLFMMLASASVLVTGRSFEASLWVLQGFGPLTLRLDVLSSVFLLTAGIVYFSASLFVRNFIDDQFGASYPARYGVMYFALMASVALILLANDAPLFLISWECMSILCFLLINYEQRQQADKSAGYIMLAMSEAGFLAVVIAFLILGKTAVSFSFPALGMAASGLSNRGLCLSSRVSRLWGEGRIDSCELLAPEILHGGAISFHSHFCGCHTQSGFLWHPAIKR